MTKRNVYFFDMVVTAQGKLNRKGNPILFEAKPKSISEISKHIKKIFDGGDNFLQKGRLKDSPRHYLKDFRDTPNEIILLVNRCDPKAPDMVTSDPENDEHTVHTKPPGHGGDYSAHVIIKKSPFQGDNYYLCAIETLVGSGLNSTVIKSFLNHLLKKCRIELKKEYKISDISDSDVLVRHVHQLTFHGHPSDSFLNDLENGSLSGLEAVNYSHEGKTLGNNGAIVERYRTINLKPNNSLIGDIKASLLATRNKLMSDYKEYPYLRLRFTDHNGDSKSAEILVENGLLVNNDKYVKKHELQSIAVNQTSYKEISDAIINEIHSLL